LRIYTIYVKVDYAFIGLSNEIRFDYITSAVEKDHAVISHLFILTNNFEFLHILVRYTIRNLLEDQFGHFFEKIPFFEQICDDFDLLGGFLRFLNKLNDLLYKIIQPSFLLLTPP